MSDPQTMRRTLFGVCRLFCLLASQVWSEELPPPRDVHLDSELLRWDPAPHSSPVTYTAQFLDFDSPPDGWKDVPGCVQTRLTSCNVSVLQMTDCDRLRLHVQAMTGDHRSISVEAYSRDQICSPVFTLSIQPGSLTIYMYNNSLDGYAPGHDRYSMSYSRDGHAQPPISTRSSETLKGLQAGELVCVKLQYTLYDKPYGPPSQEKCDRIPVRERDIGEIVGISVAVLIMASLLVLAIAYIIINKREEIKKFLHPPMLVPPHFEEFFSQPFSVPPQTQTDCEERYDQVSLILHKDDNDPGGV